MLHSQINAHKESLPFLMSKKWEAVHQSTSGLFGVLENLGIAWRYTRVVSLGLMVMLWKRFSIKSLSKYLP